MRDYLVKAILEEKIVAIVRGIPDKQILDITRALLEGGVRFVEVALDHSQGGGWRETLQSIRLLKAEMGGKVEIGAGTVLTPEQVDCAQQAGARYIISPNVNPDVIARTRELGMVSIPGAFTPSEIAMANERGADIVKLFPADALGPRYVKAVNAPLGHIPLMATGGVTAENIPSFLDAGAACFGVGGSLVSAKPLDGSVQCITDKARAMRTAVSR